MRKPPDDQNRVPKVIVQICPSLGGREAMAARGYQTRWMNELGSGSVLARRVLTTKRSKRATAS